MIIGWKNFWASIFTMNEKREQLVLEKSEQFEQKKCLQVDSKLFDKMITSEGL